MKATLIRQIAVSVMNFTIKTRIPIYVYQTFVSARMAGLLPATSVESMAKFSVLPTLVTWAILVKIAKLAWPIITLMNLLKDAKTTNADVPMVYQ